MPSLLESLDPATQQPIGSVPVTDAADVPAIVARARAALPSWRDLGLQGRRDVLRGAHAALESQAEAIGELLSREMGKPLREAVGEVKSCASGFLAELDEMVEALSDEVLQDGRTRTVLVRDPFGVATVITPWNYPFSMPHWMALPALMAGNTVVFKPSELTPLVGQAWADVFNGVLPPDVLQVVHGDEVQGKALVEADVDLVAFTGSRNAGAHILTTAGGQLKRVVLELGGKDPMVVLEDADVARAARFAVRNSFRNAGQVCVSTERIYVHEAIAEPLQQAMVAQAQQLKMGPGIEEGVDVGPMVSPEQKAHVLRQVRAAVEQGATVLFGGEEGPGNWLPPTILTNVTHDMDIMRQETFGPVACVMAVPSEAEAIRLANDTPYGLGAVLFCGDEARGQTLARQLQAGMVGINRGVGGAHGAPWVGAKQSGYGFHSGRDGHRQFAQARIISARTTVG